MTSATIRASCLCGGVRWEVEGPLGSGCEGSVEALLAMSHCHCGRCRKAHGSAYATYVVAPAERFRITQGEGDIVRYVASPDSGSRPFCGRCGSVVPDGVAWQGRVGMPAGTFDDDPGLRPTAHIFVASKAPWFEIHDTLPRFDAYPPGFDAPVLPDRAPSDPKGAPRGSCLCGQVAYVLDGPVLRSRTCHCSRCRKAGSAAHVSYAVTKGGAVRLTRGGELRAVFKVPGAQHFEQVFCRVCGSSLPRSSPARGIDIVPMGTLDDDPVIRPACHIFVGSKAPWDAIADELPRYDEYPPS